MGTDASETTTNTNKSVHEKKLTCKCLFPTKQYSNINKCKQLCIYKSRLECNIKMMFKEKKKIRIKKPTK